MKVNLEENFEVDINNPNINDVKIHSELKESSKHPLTRRPFQEFEFQYINNPLSEIENCKSVIIIQKPEYFEIVTGFERNISYNIFGQDSQGYKYLFKCIENTNCILRCICPTLLRKLDMDFIHITSEQNESKKMAKSLKPCKCPCFGLCRPQITLTLNESNEKIGTIIEPFHGCDSFYEIYDDLNNLKYLISAKCCQCGLLFSNSIFGGLGEAYFSILDPESKEQIGNISKKSPAKYNDLKEFESYKIDFPENANAKDKLLLVTLGLMIDYIYFEIDPSKI